MECVTLYQSESEGQYLEKTFAFLKEYQWIYNCRNTDILSRQVLSNFSKEWKNYLDGISVDELHALVKGQVQECAPKDLKSLIDKLNYLNPKVGSDLLEINDSLCNKINGLSDKKAHEIAFFAPVINEICQESGSELIVDVGSGVGHLPHLLHDKYGYRVLALEMSSKLINTARQKQEKLHPQSREHVVFEELFVTESSYTDIEKLIDKNFGQSNNKICLTGLHACADLSVEVLKLFVNLQHANALIIMPCCYHRMTMASDGLFKSFPSSTISKKLFAKYEASSFMGQPFLRLACQQTKDMFVKMSVEEHDRHARQCIYRAILQTVADMENCAVRRLKRKSGKSNARDSDEGFRDYLNNLDKTHELVGRSPGKQIKVTDEAFLSRMHEKWIAHKNDCWQVEVLMGLQAAIQGVCENVILLDRVAFLKEKNVHCYKRKITNDCISPRCWALIAKKSIS